MILNIFKHFMQIIDCKYLVKILLYDKCHYGNYCPLVRQTVQCNVFFDVITNCLNSFFGSLLGNVDGVNEVYWFLEFYKGDDEILS